MNHCFDNHRLSLEPAAARALARRLQADGFDEESLARLQPPGGVARRRPAAAAPNPRVLSTWARLLVAGEALAASRLIADLGESALELLVSSGVAAYREGNGDFVQPLVSLRPVDGLLIAADTTARHKAGSEDCVPQPGPASRALARILSRKPVSAALDLGCGTGYLACCIARYGQRVVATDLSTRAVAFSRFNAALNGLDNIECRSGSLFEPVCGERFDLIACNPPYVISPGHTYRYRDGGPELCRAIIDDAAAHLSEDGLLQMGCNWPQRRDGDWRKDLAQWFEGRGCDTWVLFGDGLDAQSYAATWIQQERGETTGVDEDARFELWCDYLDDAGIAHIGAGFINLRRSRRQQPWLKFSRQPQITGWDGRAIDRGFAAQDLIEDSGDVRALLGARLRPVSGLECRQQSRLDPAGSGWRNNSTELRLTEGMAFAARVHPRALELLARFDGRRTLREAINAGSAKEATDAQTLVGSVRLVVQLLGLGLIEAVDAGGESESGIRAAG